MLVDVSSPADDSAFGRDGASGGDGDDASAAGNGNGDCCVLVIPSGMMLVVSNPADISFERGAVGAGFVGAKTVLDIISRDDIIEEGNIMSTGSGMVLDEDRPASSIIFVGTLNISSSSDSSSVIRVRESR